MWVNIQRITGVAHCANVVWPDLDSIQTADATAHERTQHRLRLLIKRLPESLRHGQDDMPVDDALMQHLADLADPAVDVNCGAA